MVVKSAWLSIDDEEDEDSNVNDESSPENGGEQEASGTGAASAAGSGPAIATTLGSAAASGSGSGGGGLPPPFLTKTYEMIDDECTNAVVSWNSKGSSFIVWNPPELSKDLLPKYFKHNNFSSFVRQLNTYGFRKVDPDRWEFANEGFLRGQKHLLKNIHRRKPSSSGHPSHGGATGESNKQKLEAEIEKLNRDKTVLMQELVRLRQQQQETERELQVMGQRVHGTELRQQHMVSFLVRAIQSPGVLAHLVQQSRSNGGARNEDARKRKLSLLEHRAVEDDSDTSGGKAGQIVSYEPHESTRAKLIEFFSSPDLPSKLEAPLEVLVRELIPTAGRDQDEEAECHSSRGTTLQTASSEISSRDNSSPSVVTDVSNSNNFSSNRNISSTPENFLPPTTPPLLSLVLEVKQPESGISSSTSNLVPTRKPLEGEMNASVDSGALGVGINDVFWERFLTEEDAAGTVSQAGTNTVKTSSTPVTAPWWARIKP